MRKLEKWMLAAILICGTVVCLTSCKDDDEPFPVEEDVIATPDQLKKGIWTEYDKALVTSGKYTEDQVAQMPTVGMWIDGDKGYFFTYTAEDVSETVEGQISYDNTKGTGSIFFPAIKDNPLSNQTVNFKMTTDETMEFDFTYEGQNVTGTCAWLCENLDHWSSDITDDDWMALMSYYETIPAESGPDATIDWGSPVEIETTDDEGNTVTVEVTGLDEPLEWNESVAAATRALTRGEGDISDVIDMGDGIMDQLFGMDEKLDDIQGMLEEMAGVLVQIVENQQKMMLKLEEIDERLKAIAEKLNHQEIVNIFNTRNITYYNRLVKQNTKYFDAAYDIYKKNNKDPELGEYAKAWVGKNEEYADLTWDYLEYLSTVEHSKYGKGMAAIYDGMTYDKYPWEHMGTGDRLNYRAYDLSMLCKCLYMITLYSAYGDLTKIEKKGLYNVYKSHKPKLMAFSKFTVANPKEFLVCQIPGAHFVMHKELQTYNYKGKNNESPHPAIYGKDAVYMPRWHEAGNIKIENPQELKSKLIRTQEMAAIVKYYNPGGRTMSWYKMLVDGENTGGAVCATTPYNKKDGYGREWQSLYLVLYDPTKPSDNGVIDGREKKGYATSLLLNYVMERTDFYLTNFEWMGRIGDDKKWSYYNSQYYMAIVEKHF